MITRFVNTLFGCHHQNTSRVFTVVDTKHSYIVCLKCGKEIDYPWEKLGNVPVVFRRDTTQEQVEVLERMYSGEVR